MSNQIKIKVHQYGGEHVIGNCLKSIAKYWKERGQTEFESYQLSTFTERQSVERNIPEQFHLPEWWEIDDISHLYAAEFHPSNWLQLIDWDSDETLYEIKLGSLPSDQIIRMRSLQVSATEAEKSIIFGQSFEKGEFDYGTLNLDLPFNLRNLTVSVIEWDEIHLLKSLEYEGVQLDQVAGDTVTKSQTTWIA